MATLGNIRNRSGLLLSVIGIAMLSFILGDFLKSTNSGGGQGLYVGNVLGEDVLRQNFEVKVEEGIENWKNQNKQSVLNQTTIDHKISCVIFFSLQFLYSWLYYF